MNGAIAGLKLCDELLYVSLSVAGRRGLKTKQEVDCRREGGREGGMEGGREREGGREGGRE